MQIENLHTFKNKIYQKVVHIPNHNDNDNLNINNIQGVFRVCFQS